MLNLKSYQQLFITLFFLFIQFDPKFTFAQKIILEPSMAVNESGNGAKAGNLLDEQILSGDPLSGRGGIPITSWFPGWEDIYYPASVTIDLKDEYDLKNLFFFDGANSANIFVEFGEPYNWKYLLDEPLNKYNEWVGHDIKVTTRFLRFTLKDKFTNFSEIVLYGTEAKARGPEPEPKYQLQPTVDNFIGINGFVTNPVEKLKVAGMVREYHLWNWDESNYWDNWNGGKPSLNTGYPGYPNNKIVFNSPFMFQFDDFYNNCKKSDLKVVPCIQGSASWLTYGGTDKPVPIGTSTLEPNNYVAHSNYLYQFIARYGSKKIDETLLKLSPDEKKLSGLNTLQYIENSNEPDRWWQGKDAFFNPYELAAMSSADYDGHLGTMGNTVGVKNADPDCKMVMSGLTRISLDYIRTMKEWSDRYRNGSFPADVINFHQYSTDSDGQNDNAKTGISPEADNLKGKMKEITDYRDRYLPGKEVWLSEFGYDTDPKSIFRAPAFGSFSPDEVQGQWIIRSLLELAAAKVDRAIIYRLADDNATDPSIRFATSGLTLPDYKPKKSWYYVYSMKNILKGMRFTSEVISNNKERVYSFKKDGSEQGVFAVWSPTAEDKMLWGYKLKIGKAKSAKLVELEDNNTEGKETILNIQDGSVTFDVGERPVFIVVDILDEAITAISSEELNNNIKVYPTLTDKDFTVALNNNFLGKNINLNLFDNKGMVKQNVSLNGSLINQYTFNLSTLPQGIYFLKIEIDGALKTEKIIKY